MSINLSSLPGLSLPGLPDASSIPLPSVSDVSDALSDVIVTAIDSAGDAATIVVASARRRPKVAIGVGVAAVAVLVVFLLRRRHHTAPEQYAGEDQKPRIAAA